MNPRRKFMERHQLFTEQTFRVVLKKYRPDEYYFLPDTNNFFYKNFIFLIILANKRERAKLKIKFMVKYLLTLLGFVFFCFTMSAQMKSVSGLVVNREEGNPLSGVSVVVKGTATGTTTNDEGFYELETPENVNFLVFSFIGMKTLEVPVESSVIDVAMEPDVVGLNEVVVVAYGTSLKQQFTGSLTTIYSAQLERFNSSGFSETLQGIASGVLTADASGQPGEVDEIRIRGFSTFGNANPLIVLDGFPFDGNLNALPLAEIESITVLKDAPSTALYGSRAANGVIIVTTKQGNEGASGFNLRMSYGISDRAIPEYEKVSVSQYYELQWEGLRNSLMENGFSANDAALEASKQLVPVLGGYNAYDVPAEELVGPDGKINPNSRLLWHDNWQDELIKIGNRRELSLDAGGGNEKSTYFLSGSFLDEEGIIKASNLKRYAVRTNLESRLTPNITAGINLSGSLSEQNHPESSGPSLLNPFRFTGFVAPVYPVYLYDEQGNLQTNGKGEKLFDYGTGFGRTRPFGSNINPLGTIELDERIYKNDVFTLRSHIDFKLAEGLMFIASMSADYFTFDGLTHKNMRYGDGQNFNGSTTRQSNRTLSHTANQMLRFNRIIGKHELQFLAAHENYSYKNNVLTATRSGFPFPGLVELDGAAIAEGSGSFEDNYRLESYFGKVDYSFNNRYFASFNYRSDGNSRFGKDVRWGNFWGAGLAWLLSEEDFLQNYNWLDILKFKASYGKQGNDRIGSYYGYQGLYQTGINNIDYPGLIASQLSTPGLTWESLNAFNVGVYLILKERFSFNLEYYSRQNNDVLFEKPLPPSTGFTFVDDNVARIANKGFDLEMTGILLSVSDFKWTLDINVSHFGNEIKELPQNFIITGDKRWEKGKSIYDFWIEDYAGVNLETGKAQWFYNIPETDANGIPVTDEFGNPVYGEERGITESHTLADRYYSGSSIPDFFGGINNNFSYYGFDLSVLIAFKTGGKVFDNPYQRLMHSGLYGSNFHSDILNRWTPERSNTNVPSVDGDQFANARSTFFLADADYLNFRNVVLGYQFPNAWIKKMNLESIRLNIKADNLLLLSARKGLNPRQSFDGHVEPDYVPLRTVSIGFDIHFL